MPRQALSAVFIFIMIIVGWLPAPAQFRAAESCKPGTPISFYDRGKYGYLTPSGIVIPARFESAYSFFPGLPWSVWQSEAAVRLI